MAGRLGYVALDFLLFVVVLQAHASQEDWDNYWDQGESSELDSYDSAGGDGYYDDYEDSLELSSQAGVEDWDLFDVGGALDIATERALGRLLRKAPPKAVSKAANRAVKRAAKGAAKNAAKNAGKSAGKSAAKGAARKAPAKPPPPKAVAKAVGKVAAVVKQNSNSEGAKVGCFKRSYGRGVGKINLGCPEGKDTDAGLCYDKCPNGFRGVGPVCWKGVPLFSAAHPRGVGKVMTPNCGKGNVNDAGLCYPECQPGTRGIGPVCWGFCAGTYPEDCGAMCVKKGKCAYATGRMGQQAFNVLKTALEAGKCATGPQCVVGLAKQGIDTGLDMKKFFAEEMDNVCKG